MTWSVSVATLADKVGTDYDVVLAITRGALVPAGMLAYRLGLRNILVAAVAYYDDTGQPAEQPTFLQFPADPLLHARRVLIIDEVWDTGTTIAAVVERVELAGGRADDRRPPLQAGPVEGRRRAGPLRRLDQRLGRLPVQVRRSRVRGPPAAVGRVTFARMRAVASAEMFLRHGFRAGSVSRRS